MEPIITDEQFEALAKKRVTVIQKLRGNNLCCQNNRNIVFLERPVDATFDIHRADHQHNEFDRPWKCFCRVCKSKYYAKPDLSDKTFLTRL